MTVQCDKCGSEMVCRCGQTESSFGWPCIHGGCYFECPKCEFVEDETMTFTRDEKLVVLIEEAAEIIQAATKCIRFGWDRNQPDYGVNHEVLAAEIGDLLGIVDALDLDQGIIEYYRRNKLVRTIHAKQTFVGTK